MSETCRATNVAQYYNTVAVFWDKIVKRGLDTCVFWEYVLHSYDHAFNDKENEGYQICSGT